MTNNDSVSEDMMRTVQPRCNRSKRGMTLIEVLLVVTILLVIASAVVPRLVNRQEQANIDATRISIKGLAQALKLYAVDHDGMYPSASEGLDALLAETAGDTSWNGPYLESPPRDAWRRDFKYVFPAVKSNQPFDLSSGGPDGVHGNGDDVCNWEGDAA